MKGKTDNTRIEKKIQFYDMAISNNLDDHNAHNLKGQAYVELAEKTNNQEFYNNAIECFSKAIEINPNESAYVCDRAKIYALVGESEKAVVDFRKVNELMVLQKGKDILNDLYVQNTLKEIAKLDNIKNTIQSLRNNGELPTEFLDAFDSLTNVTANLCATVGDHSSQLQQLWKVINNILIELDHNSNDKIAPEVINKMQEAIEERLELSVFKVSKEISSNTTLKDYYDALYSKLHSAMIGADTIASGQLTLNTADIKVTAVSAGLSLIPIVGKYVGSAFEGGVELIKSNKIKDHVIKFTKLTSLNPDDRNTILKKTAEKITLDKKQDIEFIENNEEVLNWKEKGLIVRCKDFVVINMNDKIYQSKAQILGCIDALKIILAITTDQTKPGNIKEVIDQLVKIPNKYIFSDNREIVLKPDEDYDSFPIIVGVFDDLNDMEVYQKKSSILLKDNKIDNLDSNMEPLLSESSEGKISNTLTNKTCCEKLKETCTIFSITEIKYDNPILNYPEMLKTLTNNLSMNYFEVVDKVSGFDKDFVREVCLSGNVELLQECFEL